MVFDCHHSGRNAFSTSSAYVDSSGTSTESSGAICWPASGRRARIFFAVSRSSFTFVERPQRLDELVADDLEGAPVGRHLEGGERRADRLRREARVRDAHAGRFEVAVPAALVHEGVGVAIAPDVDAVEGVLRAAVPELAIVEDRV